MFAVRRRTSLLHLPAGTLFARFESTEAAVAPPPHRRRPYDSKPRPHISRTHFLTIPLYEHSPDLQAKIAKFRDNIIACNLTGLTEDSVIPRLSHFLELRLGNLNIEGFKAQSWIQRRPFRGQPKELTRAEKTPIPLQEVQQVLDELKAPIQEILTADGDDGALRVPLGNIRPLLHGPRASFNAQKVNLLFLEPSDGPAAKGLRAVNELVFKRFHEAGIWVDTNRPSALSMTLGNVRYAKGRAVKPYEERIPFDILALYESEAFKAVSGGPPVAPEGYAVDGATPRPVVLGEAIARSLHLIPIREAEPQGVSEAERADVHKKPDFMLEF